MSRPDKSFAFHPDESFNGAVARWAAAAWIERMMDVTRVAGVTFGHRQNAASADKASIRALADAMQVDVDELLARATPSTTEGVGARARTRMFDLEMPITLLEKRQRLHSPSALRTSPHHRALWDVRLLPACVETGEVLLNRCQNPICEGKTVGWQHTAGIDRCEHCMTDLGASVADTIPATLQERLGSVADLLRPSTRGKALSGLPSSIAALGAQVAFDLLVRLVPVANPDLVGFLKDPRRVDPLVLSKAVADAWDLVAGWPDAFHDFAMRRINDRVGSHGDGNRRETIRFLKARPSTINPDAVVALAAELLDGIDLAGSRGPQLAFATCSVKKAAGIIGRGTAIVADMRRRGHLSSILVMDHSRNLQPMFSCAEVAQVAADIRARVGLNSVHSRLGIAYQGAEQLAELGMLELLTHPMLLPLYGVPQVTMSSFEALLAHFDPERIRRCGDADVPLASAMRFVGGRFKPWGPVLAALRNGEFPFRVETGDGPLAKRLHVRRKDVRPLASLHYQQPTHPTVAPATAMSKQDAMEILNLASRQGTEFLSSVPTRKGQRTLPLTVSSILDLATKYMSASELGMRRGISSGQAYADAVRRSVPSGGAAGFLRIAAEQEFLGG